MQIMHAVAEPRSVIIILALFNEGVDVRVTKVLKDRLEPAVLISPIHCILVSFPLEEPLSVPQTKSMKANEMILRRSFKVHLRRGLEVPRNTKDDVKVIITTFAL